MATHPLIYKDDPVDEFDDYEDSAEDFLKNLKEVGADKPFCFGCDPEIACFNRCCSDLNLMLTPYDALRLRKSLGESSRRFLNERTRISTYPDTGFPSVHLKMGDDMHKSCPFLTAEGCGVYADRPAACRSYPVGRAMRMNQTGDLETQYFLVEEPHCQGFERSKSWTPESWNADQGLDQYYAASDRYAAFMAAIKRHKVVLDNRRATMALLALYQPDDFARFAGEMRLFDRLGVDEARRAEVEQDEAAALELGHDWLDALLYGPGGPR